MTMQELRASGTPQTEIEYKKTVFKLVADMGFVLVYRSLCNRYKIYVGMTDTVFIDYVGNVEQIA